MGEEKINTATISYTAGSGIKTVAKIENIGKGVWELSGFIYVNGATGAGTYYSAYLTTADNSGTGSTAGLSNGSAVIGGSGVEYGCISFPPFNVIITNDTDDRYLCFAAASISGNITGTIRMKRVA